MAQTSKLKHCEATWNTNFPKRYSFGIYLGFRFWPFLITDQWFLPRLKLHIQNLGETIPRAQVSVCIAETSDVSTFANFPGPFQDIKHFGINDFLSGKVKKLKLKIPSKFLKPTSYMIRVTILKFEPSPSIFEQMKETIFAGGNPTLEKIQVFNEAIDVVQRQVPDLSIHEAPSGVYRGIPLCDWRLNEVLKVHSVAGPAGIAAVIAVPASALALVTLLGAFANFMKDQSPLLLDYVIAAFEKLTTK